jgi:hypothetical protein
VTRIAAGELNAAQLTRELIARGYRGSYQAVRRAVARERVRHPMISSDPIAGRDPIRRVAPLSPRQAAWLLRRVDDAPGSLLAALCFRWSTGQVEGHVQRLKVLKRAMYGRAKFDLLRKRVLHAA